MISDHASRHHWNVHRSLPGRLVRMRRAAYVRRTTQLLLFQNKTIQIKGVTYSLDRLIGRGGQGAVYQATGPQGQRFAIKMLIWEESTLTTERLLHPSAESFLRELEFMLYLKPHSKHFVEFYDVDVKKVVGLVLGFILMELGDGYLDQMIKEMSNRKTRVILYYMTYGTIPRVTNIGCSDASTPPPGKQIVQDANLQNILRLTLQMNPDYRPTSEQLQQHPYTLSVS